MRLSEWKRIRHMSSALSTPSAKYCIFRGWYRLKERLSFKRAANANLGCFLCCFEMQQNFVGLE